MNRYKFIENTEPMGSPDCPKCGQEQHCPCKSCADRNEGLVTWVWQSDGESIACGKCGLVMGADEWEEREMEYSQRRLKQ